MAILQSEKASVHGCWVADYFRLWPFADVALLDADFGL
ncbi:hypothetical protein ABIF78_008898 [Bradyrhizobium japonicum]